MYRWVNDTHTHTHRWVYDTHTHTGGYMTHTHTNKWVYDTHTHTHTHFIGCWVPTCAPLPAPQTQFTGVRTMANPIRAGHWPRCGEVICTGAPCGKGKISEQLKLKTVFHS